MQPDEWVKSLKGDDYWQSKFREQSHCALGWLYQLEMDKRPKPTKWQRVMSQIRVMKWRIKFAWEVLRHGHDCEY